MFKNVAIVTVPSLELERPPAAPAVLGGICKSLGVDYEIYDINLHLAKVLSEQEFRASNNYWRTDPNAILDDVVIREFNNVIDEILSNNHDLIALSVFTLMNTRASLLFCNLIKDKRNVMLVAGGQGLTIPYGGLEKFGYYLLENNHVDYIAHGDGEIIWANWLKGNFEVPGTNYIPGEQIKDLEKIPYADFTKCNPWDYFYNYNNPGIYLTASRGCVRRCTFCDIPHRWPKYRYRTGKHIAKEMFHHYNETGVQLYQFTDSVLNGNLKEFKKLNEEIIALKEQNPEWDPKWVTQFNIRKKSDMPEIFYELMSKSGADNLVVGVEHASWRVREHMGKEFDDEDLDHHLAMCAKYGIQNIVLMFVGYPTETLEDHQKNIDFLYEKQKYIRSGTIALIRWGFTGSLDRGSRLEYQDLGLEFVPEFPNINLTHLEEQEREWVYGRNWINKNNPTLTLAERLRRRLEVHEISSSLNYPITKGKEELKILKIIAEQLIEKSKDSVGVDNIIASDAH